MGALSGRAGDKSPAGHQIGLEVGYESQVSQAAAGRAAVESNQAAAFGLDQGVIA